MAASSFLTIIEQYFQRNGGISRLKGELAVYFWPRIAGNELAAKVNALRFRDGQLYLQTDNPALAHELTLLSQDILKRYRKVLGSNTVRGIKVKIGSIQPENKKEDSIPEIHLSENEQQHIQSCSQTISDPELASKFACWMQRHYENNQLKQLQGGSKCPSCGVVIEQEQEYCPCCEMKLVEEIQFYLSYLHKNKQEIAATDLNQGLGKAHQVLTTRILQNTPREE